MIAKANKKSTQIMINQEIEAAEATATTHRKRPRVNLVYKSPLQSRLPIPAAPMLAAKRDKKNTSKINGKA